MENKKPIRFWKLIWVYPLAILLLFEEWGWEPLAAFFEKLVKLRVWKKIEDQIILLPPKLVLLVFGLPIILLLPLKILAIYFLSKGHLIIGTLIILSAKIFGTAICARLFKLTKPILLEIQWFAKFYPKWKIWKDHIIEMLKETRWWKDLKKIKRMVKVLWKQGHRLRN